QTEPITATGEADASHTILLLDRLVKHFGQFGWHISIADAVIIEKQHPGAVGPVGDRSQFATALADFDDFLEGVFRHVAFRPTAVVVPQQRPAAAWGEGDAFEIVPL